MSRSLLLLCGGLTVVGCSADTDQTVSETFVINATNSPGQDGCSTVTHAVTLRAIAAFERIQDRVQKVELRSVKVTVVNPKIEDDSVATTAHGVIAVSEPGGTSFANLGVYEPLALTADNSADATIDTSGADEFAALATSSPFSFDVAATGCVDAYPARFSFQVDMKARVTFKLF